MMQKNLLSTCLRFLTSPPKHLRCQQFCAISQEAAIEHLAPSRIRQKHKIPKKRASKIMQSLKDEEFEKLKNGRNWVDIQPGDTVQIEKLPYISATQPDILKGLVIAKVNRKSDSAIRILNVEHGTPLERRIVLYNPLITNIKILEKNFLHKGKKKVRRSKLYYMRDRDPKEFTIV